MYDNFPTHVKQCASYPIAPRLNSQYNYPMEKDHHSSM